MALSTKNSVLAIVKETVEGTPIAPSSGGDFLALQDGFDVEPSFTELDNEELTGSIGKAKPILGTEEPSVSLSHYLRGSGVEGTQVNFGDILESLFGSLATQATERDVVSATVSSITLDVGEGAEYERGKAFLVKKTTGVGYEIRNALSVSGDVVTLAQNLNDAPAAAVALGRPVLYKPADTGHPTLSAWLYRGNNAAGAIELTSGCRVTEGTLEATAGELINGSFTLSGVEFFYDPIVVSSTSNKIDFDDAGGEENVTITAKTYKDPYELADAVASAMNGATTDVITVTYDDTTGKYTIASDGATLSLLWSTGTNGSGGTDEHVGTLMGFDDSADDTGATTYLADLAIDKSAQFTPSFDVADPLTAKANEVILSSDSTELACFPAQSVTVNYTNEKKDILDVCAASGKSGSIVNSREITIDVVATLESHQALEFKDFREGNKVLFTYNAGEKSGGNWVAGKSTNYHTPSSRISAFKLADDDGLVTLEMTLTCFVESGLSEFYMNTL